MTCSALGAVQAPWADGLHSAALWGAGAKVRAEWELTIPAMIKLLNFCCQSFPLAVDFLFPYGNTFCKTAGRCPPHKELSVLELLWIPQWLGHCRAEPDTPGNLGHGFTCSVVSTEPCVCHSIHQQGSSLKIRALDRPLNGFR